MAKPDIFQKRHVTLQTIPYLCGDISSARVSLDGGVLARGEVVWTIEEVELTRSAKLTCAFVESVGIISLEPARLVRAGTSL
ncbi:MAG: hypothetical protein ACRYFU_20445 [Janthinobacterium lividum]